MFWSEIGQGFPEVRTDSHPNFRAVLPGRVDIGDIADTADLRL